MDGGHRPIRLPAITASTDDHTRQAQHALREAVLDLIRALQRGILTDETLAEEIAHIANGDAVGDPVASNALRAIARNHRIRALEGRARIAGVIEAYAHLLDPI